MNQLFVKQSINQSYAIRNNVGNKQAMHDAIWAIYFHSIISTKEPLSSQHRYFPTGDGTWCRYWKSQKDQSITYSNSKRLPEVFLAELLPIFSRLTADSLLDRCLQGLTQNQNESLNGLVWSICPKTRFFFQSVQLWCISYSFTLCFLKK